MDMDMNKPEAPKPHGVSTGVKVVLLILAIVLLGFMVYLVWFTQDDLDVGGGVTITKKKTATPTLTTTKTATSTKTATATSTSSSLVYTNTTCGFTLTFPASWQGYKIKEAQIEGATNTYYVNMPTTDKESVWVNEESTHFAKYASLFAFSTYTAAQWTAVQSDPNTPSKIGECGVYTVAYTPAQAYPQDIQDKNLAKDVKSIVATFKATK